MGATNSRGLYYPSDVYRDISPQKNTPHWVVNLYYIGFLICALTSLIAWSAWGAKVDSSHRMLLKSIRAVGAAILMLKMVIEGHGAREWALSLGFLAVAITSTLVTDEWGLFWIALFVVSARGVKLERIAQLYAPPMALFIAFTFVMWMLGLSEGIIGNRYGRIRPSLGFASPNGLGLTVYKLMTLLAILWWRKHPWRFAAAGVALLIPVEIIANSRAAAVAIMCLMILVAADSLLSRKPTWHKAVFRHLPKACLALLLLLLVGSLIIMIVYQYDDPLMKTVDHILSKRLSLGHAFFQLYPPRLFGLYTKNLPKVHLPNGSYQSFLVDIGYQRFFINYGIAFSLCYFSSLATLHVHAVREHHANACLLMLSVQFLYALMETSPLFFTHNFFLLALRTVFLDEPVSSVDLDVERQYDEAIASQRVDARGSRKGKHVR